MFVLQKEPPETSDPRLTTQLYVIPIHSHSQPATPLTDLSDLQLRDPFLSCPVGTHRAIGGTADVVFINARSGGEHPNDVIFCELPAR